MDEKASFGRPNRRLGIELYIGLLPDTVGWFVDLY